MNSRQPTQTPNGVYIFNPEIDSNQLSDAINAGLCKAEALAIIAATIDFETYNPYVISNYLWALSDIIQEAKWLYMNAHEGSQDRYI